MSAIGKHFLLYFFGPRCWLLKNIMRHPCCQHLC